MYRSLTYGISALVLLAVLGAPSQANAANLQAEMGIQLSTPSETTWVTDQVSVGLYDSKGKTLASCASGKTVDVIKSWMQFTCLLSAPVDPADVVWVELVSKEISEVAKADYWGQGLSELLSYTGPSVGFLAVVPQDTLAQDPDDMGIDEPDTLKIDLGDEEPNWQEVDLGAKEPDFLKVDLGDTPEW